MQWDDLRFVLAVARAGTMTAAARALGVTHTTVSRRLRAFEQQTGLDVFERTTEGYRPTASGETVIGVAERLEEEILGLARHAAGQDERLSGALRVTTVDVFAMWFGGAISSFIGRYPRVELSLVTDHTLANLTRREADIALRGSNTPPEHLVGRRLGHLDYALYGAGALVERFPPDVPLDKLPWMAWESALGARVTEAWMRTHVPRARVACRVDCAPVMIDAVSRGVGVQFLPCFAADRVPGLVRLRPVEPGFGVDLWLLTHPDLRQSARVKAFLRHVGAAITQELAMVSAGPGV